MFHNIFSKKKTNQEKQTIQSKIMIDNREKNSLVASELAKLQIPIEFRHLQVGDYLINNIAIERKTLSDLNSSIIDKRIFVQMQELKQYPKCLLIVEGINEEMYLGIIHENALRGFLLATALDYQIPIIFTQNEKDTAKYISILAKKTSNKEISIRASKILKSKSKQIQFILEGFPNVGPVKAKKLIDKFKSLKNIINADELQLKEILGKKTSEIKYLIEHEISLEKVVKNKHGEKI